MDEFLSGVNMRVIRIMLTFGFSFAINRYGKRPIAIVSSTGMCFVMIGLVIYQLLSLRDSSFSWLSAVFLFGYCIFGVPGSLPIPVSMMVEVYPQKLRSFLIGFAFSFCFILVFCTKKSFSFFIDYFGDVAMFSFYAFISALSLLFSIFILPETQRKSLRELNNISKDQHCDFCIL